MTQQEFNASVADTMQNLMDLVNQQQAKIEAMQSVLTTVGKGLTDTMETVQHHDEGINMIMQKMIELGFDK